MSTGNGRERGADTGLHAKHWTRAQAIEYLGPLPGLGTESEVDRYVSLPGQACSYMIGAIGTHEEYTISCLSVCTRVTPSRACAPRPSSLDELDTSASQDACAISLADDGIIGA